MKQIALALGSVLMLLACGVPVTDVEEQQTDMEAVQSVLPDGCELRYAGTVRVEGFRETRPSRLFAVTR